MKRIRCPKCGKVVYQSEKYGDLYDRRDTKKEKATVKGLGVGASYGGSYKPHKHIKKGRVGGKG